MARFPTQCPSCESPLEVARLRCTACDVQLEGDFQLPALLQLPEDDLRFVQEFVLASGSLKEMARIRGLSYPTVRNRLDDIITRLKPAQDPDADRRRILDDIAAGRLSVKDAVRRLKEMEG